MPITHLHVPTLGSSTDAARLEQALVGLPRITSVEIEPRAHKIHVEHNGVEASQLTWELLKLGHIAAADPNQ